MSDIVPVAQYNYTNLHFMTCDVSHARFLVDVENKHYYDSKMDNYSAKMSLFKTYIRDFAGQSRGVIDTMIELMKADPNILNFCIVKQIAYNIKFLINNDIPNYGLYDLEECKKLNYNTQVYFYIQTRPQLLSYLKQQNIDYYIKIFQKINFEKDEYRYLNLDNVDRLLKYLERIFAESPSNKNLQEKEIDDLMNVCKETYNKI